METRDAGSGGGSPLKFVIWMDRIPDQGEDAKPLLTVASDRGALLGVFDGMGGAGGQSYQVDGMVRSGAYLAANCVRETTADWYDARGHLDDDPAGSLHDALVRSLSARVAMLGGAPPSRVRSKMIRQLPTTVAVALVGWGAPTRCEVLWAGDSRVYVLSRKHGLAQLTVDHLREHADAQENLRLDSPMSNCVSASDAFRIERSVVDVGEPALVLAATDGCFGYVDSPAMFEYLLLSTLRDAVDLNGWKVGLTHEISEIAADDASMALFATGWSRFDDLKRDYAARLAVVEELVAPVAEARRRDRELRRRLATERAEEEVVAARLRVEQTAARDRLMADEWAAARADSRLAHAALELAEAELQAARCAEPAGDGTTGDERGRLAERRQAADAVTDRRIAVVDAKKALVEATDQVAERRVATSDPGPRAGQANRHDRSGIDEAESELRAAADSVWATYRHDYERWLPVPMRGTDQPEDDR